MGRLPVIRRATPDDVDRVRAIARAAYSKYIERIGREPVPMLADFMALTTAGRVVVAQAHDGIKGYMVGWPETDAYYIDNIAIDPAHQGQGLGRYLIEHAATEANRLGLPAVRLHTNVAMTENLAIYTHIGFVETHRGTGDGFHRVYLRWDLDDRRHKA
jgi:ribosomal protein S18 acetylase RimI-like enzyme